ncbi:MULTISPECIES: cysteine-rich CWC family protein [unclassified Pseudomonas]|uniref:cysteine-rich CWC family protein n=1 Tax=unclassified Pseudomonas TaxID=196821 RepID=UPI0025E19A2F|nr:MULTISPECIES: cysteine-rich CWC family protein [unclassified Pseudomonas]
MTSSANLDICPVCGQGNRCTLADPRTVDRPCWCFSQTVDPAILAGLPEALRNKACLCPRCAGLAEKDEPTQHAPAP